MRRRSRAGSCLQARPLEDLAQQPPLLAQLLQDVAVVKLEVLTVALQEALPAEHKEASAPYKGLLWKWLVKRNIVRDVLQGELQWGDLMAEARLLASHQRDTLGVAEPVGKMSSDRSPDPPVEQVELTETEAKYAAALAPYLARRAARLREVRSFRIQKRCGTLEPDGIVAFLRTELRSLPAHEYADLECYVEEDAPSLAYGEDEELKDLVGGWVNRTDASRSDWSVGAFWEAVENDVVTKPMEPEPPYLHGLMHLIPTDGASTLADVGRLLVSRYPWTLRDAVWYALTGETPELVSLEVRSVLFSGMHSIAFAPWISEGTVRRAYRSVHQGDNRPSSDKSLETFRFVSQHTRPGQTPRWAELTERWNKEHPPDAGFRQGSALRQAYQRAEKRLAFPWVYD